MTWAGRPGAAILGAMRRMPRTRQWGPDDLAGGPVDQVFAQVRARVPGLAVARLAVAHAGDDDNVYFLGGSSAPDLVQVDTGPGGLPPFLVEADGRAGRVTARGVAEAVAAVVARLGRDASR